MSTPLQQSGGSSSGGTITNVTASSPLASSGGTTPNITVTSSTGSGAIVLAASPALTGTVTAAAITASGILTNTQNGAVSASAVSITGTPITGGSGTTTFPHVYLNSGASAPSTWATSGTVFGINAPSGFAGNLADLHVNGGGSLWLVSSGGATNQAGNLTVGASSSITFSGRTKANSSVDGILLIQNNGGTDFTRLQFGGTTASFPSLKRSATALHIRLADDSAFAPVVASSVSAGGTATWTSGTGTPEAAVTAPVGSLFTRTDGGANTTLYVKESGASNTGWVAK